MATTFEEWQQRAKQLPEWLHPFMEERGYTKIITLWCDAMYANSDGCTVEFIGLYEGSVRAFVFHDNESEIGGHYYHVIAKGAAKLMLFLDQAESLIADPDDVAEPTT